MDKPNYGYSDYSIWVRFKVENKTEKKASYFLELDNPIIDFAHLYFLKSQKINEIILGDMVLFDHRKIQNRNPIFEINFNGSEVNTFYMKFSSEGNLILPLILWEPFYFYKNDHETQILYGIYYGILIVMILYNLFLFLSVNDYAYLFYVVYLIGGLLVSMSFAGFTFEYLFPKFPVYANKSLLFGACLSISGAIQFSMSFLKSKNYLPIFDKLLRILLIIFLSSIIGTIYLQYKVVARFLLPITLFSCIIMFIAGLLSYLNGFKAARYYLLAWTFVLLGIFTFVLKYLAIIPNNFISSHGFEIGSIFELILLSFALADRINILKKEKEESQKALIAKQEESIATQKELITSYARFVPEQLLTFLGKDIITKVGLGDSIQKDMTILFSDIRAFTSISETLSPSENFGFINSYLETMGPIIRKHNGFIDKYIGDAIMALFPQKPSDAIDASIEMLEELHKLNVRRKAKGFIPISIGIGIHTGSQMLGIIGEKERMEGTVISDVVNTASRLEGLTKAYSTALLISEDVLKGVEDKSKLSYPKIVVIYRGSYETHGKTNDQI
ncbi:MAG: 7TM diverse intracellular signaling domain-containing protein [Leptospiraceae bacterium]|nr:7TM diverse intracellular signaling domain-containing protein [Leptospiraceae bacterium]